VVKAGHLEWWAKERRQWSGRVRGGDGINGGSGPLIFAPARHAHFDYRVGIGGIGILGGNKFVFYPWFGEEGYGLVSNSRSNATALKPRSVRGWVRVDLPCCERQFTFS
jgi:hypothetical protein